MGIIIVDPTREECRTVLHNNLMVSRMQLSVLMRYAFNGSPTRFAIDPKRNMQRLCEL